MPLPDDVTTFTLTFGHPDNGYTDATGAVALVGMKARLVPVDLLTGERTIVTHVETGQVIVAVDVTMTIDADGKGSVGPLPHTDNPTLSPIGFGYSVEFADVTGPRRMAPDDLVIAVPATAGSTVDFDLLGEAEAVPGVFVPIGIGPAGPAGPTGPTGATGPAGASADPAALTALSNRITANETDLAAATDAGTASTLVRRNSAGYFSANGVSNMAAPGNAGDAVNKAYADALGTQFATPSSIMRRDAFGNIYANQFYVSGTQDTDPAALTRRDYVDALGTSAITASTIVRRDASSRFQAANPSANQDVATKNYVDNTAGTDTNTASALVRRSSGGDFSARNVFSTNATPTFVDQLVRKDYVDALGSTTAIGNTIARRTAGGSSTFATAFIDNVPSAASHATRKDYVDAQVAAASFANMDLIATCDPVMALASSTSGLVNRIVYQRILGSGAITKIGIAVTVTGGNVWAALYRSTGSGRAAVPGTLVASTGVVATPAVGYAELSLGGTFIVQPGDWFAFGTDSGSSAFRSVSGTLIDGDQFAGRAMYGNSGFPSTSNPTGLTIGLSRGPLVIGVP